MSLKTKVKRSVDKAFEKLKDLSVSATFDNRLVSDFDFGTGETVQEEDSYSTFGFLGSSKRYADGSVITTVTLTIRNDPEIVFDRYSQVTIDDVTYNCSVVSRDAFIVVLSLSGG